MRKDGTGSHAPNPAVRCSLPKPKMRAVLKVVADVFREQPFQMAFVDCNDVIQQVSSAAFHPTLRHAVLPGTFEGSPHRTYLQRSNGYGDLQPVFPIQIENQKPR